MYTEGVDDMEVEDNHPVIHVHGKSHSTVLRQRGLSFAPPKVVHKSAASALPC